MSIAYATGDKSVRHVTHDDTRTLCGKDVEQIETLAIPANCQQCRTENGRLMRARLDGGE
jgi:hypothetical protein